MTTTSLKIRPEDSFLVDCLFFIQRTWVTLPFHSLLRKELVSGKLPCNSWESRAKNPSFLERLQQLYSKVVLFTSNFHLFSLEMVFFFSCWILFIAFSSALPVHNTFSWKIIEKIQRNKFQGYWLVLISLSLSVVSWALRLKHDNRLLQHHTL